MPKINEEDMVAELWNNYKAENYEQARKFFRNFKKSIDKIIIKCYNKDNEGGI